MILYEFRKKVKQLVINYLYFLKVIMTTFFTKPKDKKVFFDISEIELNRYLYNLLFFFKINDYTIYIPKNIELIGKLSKKKSNLVNF